jgi:hypothetical protein
MAKNRPRDDESLLLRSAESLGRMIGSLQRQLEVATGRLIDAKPNSAGARKAAKARSGGVRTRSGATSRGGARKRLSRAKKSATRKTTKKR